LGANCREKERAQDGTENGSSPAGKQSSAHDYSGNRFQFHPGTQGNTGLGLISEGHNGRQACETRAQTKRQGSNSVYWNALRLCAGRISAQGQQMVSKSRFVKGNSAKKPEKQEQQKPILDPKPVTTEELREPVLPSGLRYSSDPSVGCHENQTAIKKQTTERHYHRGELSTDYKDGVHQAD
jgi:hypothetical protein